ncbi:lytic transglycosylase domain-containing protein [Paenibacillus contaminans]|uniref:Lytic transglycosylase domain-containing protein n=1 Tax=Paenibacillus contaminans TaxID=450362 RepID=A0A329LRJ9_9BACL|nr:lytic transglycosylase domain-containing protein [Paenibacillus contaminans]RAV10565.1 lytic transglycosylase domain-containing protein [Paenibacillus contaminans]
MKRFRKKRWFALVLLVVLLVLFYSSDWLGKIMYPIQFRDGIEASSKKHKVDPLLVAAIIRVESNYRTDPRSKKGAIGIMQIMPDTAEWLFEREGFRSFSLADLDDPYINIEVGTKYLNLLSIQFKDNLTQVIAAYNAGPGNVNKWLKNGTWDGTFENVAQIPFWETRGYVQRVWYYYKKYMNIYADSA